MENNTLNADSELSAVEQHKQANRERWRQSQIVPLLGILGEVVAITEEQPLPLQGVVEGYRARNPLPEGAMHGQADVFLRFSLASLRDFGYLNSGRHWTVSESGLQALEDAKQQELQS